MKRFISLLLSALCAALLVSCAGGVQPTSGETASQSSSGQTESGLANASFAVYTMNAGKADCMVLKTENHMVVIDLGTKERADDVVSFVSGYGKTVDVLLITHYDKDHIGAVKKLLNKLTVKEIYLPEYEDEKPENAEEVKGYIAKHDMTPTVVTQKIAFEYDGVAFAVYPTDIFFKRNDTGSNASSLALTAAHGENVFLFTGDAEGKRLPELVDQIPDISSVDYLKVPHHGVYDEGSEAFLQAVCPAYAVICCSDAEPADGSVLLLLEKVGAEVYLTSKGAVAAYSDGKTLRVEYLK